MDQQQHKVVLAEANAGTIVLSVITAFTLAILGAGLALDGISGPGMASYVFIAIVGCFLSGRYTRRLRIIPQ